jgi:hypothetical protein
MTARTFMLNLCLVLGLLAPASAVAGDDSMSVSRCERAVLQAIQNPKSYQRIAVERRRDAGATTYTMTIAFEAANIYGTPIAAKAMCFFRRVTPSPREEESCPGCEVFVMDGLNIAGGFRPQGTSEPRILSEGGS